MEITLTERRRPKRAARWAVNGLCVLVMVLSLGFLLPAAFGLQRYVITGGSMAGSYDIGSIVFEENVPVSELRVGDVITYLPPPDSGVPNLVTHRIVEIDGNEFTTKGDANAQVDPWTFELHESTQNRVSYAVPYVGYVFIALGDRATRIALIGLPAALIALYSLVELAGALRRRPEAVDAEAPVEVPEQRDADLAVVADPGLRGAGT
jgi:signal peptidase